MAYEVTFITCEEQDPGIAKVIEENKGKIISKKSLGRRKFAYPIKKEDAGFYTSIVFEIEPRELNPLNKKFKLTEGILRYLVVETDLRAKEKEMFETKRELEVKLAPEEKLVAEVSEEVKLPVVKEEKKVAVVKKTKKEPLKQIKEKKVKPEKVEEVKEKPIVAEKPAKEVVSEVSEEERLKKLEAKLDELLKE